jgi:RNA polymerase sigma-70 factor, ECF subfamily
MQGANAGTHNGVDAESPRAQVPRQAFEHVVSNGLAPLYRRAYQVLGNAADAEDAVQDALLAAYTHLDQFRGESKISTWLAAIVYNSARMELRRRSSHFHIPLDEPIGDVVEYSVSQRLADYRPSPEDEYQNTELRSRLSHFKTRLTPTLRRTFQLRDIHGLSIREAARILGIPHGTVKAQSARARKRLKQLMQQALGSHTRSRKSSDIQQTLPRVLLRRQFSFVELNMALASRNRGSTRI